MNDTQIQPTNARRKMFECNTHSGDDMMKFR